ncbi:MAG: CBS domain-containing protein [Candidatus Lokiarchaeota archaeon]|nr:CBS domain-containing protein [Candidatus Lokiarchaeota archaeon]
MKVQDFMTEIIITAEVDTPVVKAAKLMAAEDIGSLVVTKNEVVTGIVTQRDIIAAQLLSDDVYHSLNLEDIMSSPVVSIGPDADLGQVVLLMNNTGNKHIPVIDGEVMVGIVTAGDLLRVLATMKMIADGASEAFEPSEDSEE